MNAKEYDKQMKDILRYVLYGSPQIDLNDYEMSECLFECVEKGYVLNVVLERNARGNVIGSMANPQITREGRYFLESKDPDITKRRAYWISILALIISLVAVLVSVLK